MELLIKQIEQWAEDRNIIKGSKPIDQAMKLFSEFGELADNIGKGRDCRDDIGDVFVVLTIMAKQYGYPVSIHNSWDCRIQEELSGKSKKNLVLELGWYLLNCSASSTGAIKSIAQAQTVLFFIAMFENSTLKECVQIAYNDIKDRKGVMYNGVFIKESDPAYQDALDNIEADKRLSAQKRISVNLEDL